MGTQLRTIPVSEGEVNIFSPKASVRKTSTNEKKNAIGDDHRNSSKGGEEDL
jgi:hypothetical protein